MGDVTEFKNWAGIPEVTHTGFGWGVRINGCDVFDSINQYGVKTLRSFDIVMGLGSREEAEAFRVEWLQKQLPDTDREAALREELAKANKDRGTLLKLHVHLRARRSYWIAEETKVRRELAASEQRNAALEAELEVEKINAAHWKSTIAGEGQISKEARRYRGIRDILPLNELIEATADCQSSAEWDNAVDAALKPTESGASE